VRPQVIRVYEKYMLDAVTGVQPTVERQLHLFGVIRGQPIDPAKGSSRRGDRREAEDRARPRALATPGLPAGNYLAHFGMHVFSPRIFESLEYLIASDLREKGEFQLTAAQEHLRQQTDKYWAVVCDGQRYDTGIPVRADGDAVGTGAERGPPDRDVRGRSPAFWPPRSGREPRANARPTAPRCASGQNWLNHTFLPHSPHKSGGAVFA
jgi:hypothetical protein